MNGNEENEDALSLDKERRCNEFPSPGCGMKELKAGGVDARGARGFKES